MDEKDIKFVMNNGFIKGLAYACDLLRNHRQKLEADGRHAGLKEGAAVGRCIEIINDAIDQRRGEDHDS